MPSLWLTLQYGEAFSDTAPESAVAVWTRDRPRLRRLVLAALRAAVPEDLHAETSAEITLRLVDAAESESLNRDYRGKEKPTNVLTFPYTPAPTLMADLVLCLPVLEAESAEAGIPLRDHIAHLVIHGCLHALGHTHEDDADAEAMESLEVQLLKQFRIPSPYGTLGAPFTSMRPHV